MQQLPIALDAAVHSTSHNRFAALPPAVLEGLLTVAYPVVQKAIQEGNSAADCVPNVRVRTAVSTTCSQGQLLTGHHVLQALLHTGL
jgi:hypothetical protein